MLFLEDPGNTGHENRILRGRHKIEEDSSEIYTIKESSMINP